MVISLEILCSRIRNSCAIITIQKIYHIEKTKSKFILLSYNDGGIIPLDEIEEILQKKGTVEKIPITHNIYNRMKGIANWKRKNPNTKIKEFFWLVDCRFKTMDIV